MHKYVEVLDSLGDDSELKARYEVTHYEWYEIEDIIDHLQEKKMYHWYIVKREYEDKQEKKEIEKALSETRDNILDLFTDNFRDLFVHKRENTKEFPLWSIEEALHVNILDRDDLEDHLSELLDEYITDYLKIFYSRLGE